VSSQLRCCSIGRVRLLRNLPLLSNLSVNCCSSSPQEPQSLYDEIRTFPLSKLDRGVSAKVVKQLIEEEESRLPESIDIRWPEGKEVEDGQATEAGITIGIRFSSYETSLGV